MSNFNEKSIRNAQDKDTLNTGEFLLFIYNEVFPILIQRTDNASVDAIRSKLGYTDGVFDGQPIVDRTIKSRSEGINVAEAQLIKYSNIIFTATFATEME